LLLRSRHPVLQHQTVHQWDEGHRTNAIWQDAHPAVYHQMIAHHRMYLNFWQDADYPKSANRMDANPMDANPMDANRVSGHLRIGRHRLTVHHLKNAHHPFLSAKMCGR
jgi:hypothetical protein